MRLLFRCEAFLSLEPVHHELVYEEQNDETDNRSLLRHPESQRGIAYLGACFIKPVPKQDARAQADKKPDTEEGENQYNVFFPVTAAVCCRR